MRIIANTIVLYDYNLQKIAYLENAFDISYDIQLNNIYTGSFSLPTEDNKRQLVKPFCFVELFDNEKRIELFRITRQETSRDTDGLTVYTLEHVISTLLDDVINNMIQLGGPSTRTRLVLETLLKKQEVTRWEMGDVEFDRKFEYSFQSDNIYSCILSIPKVFNETYKWEFDTTIIPWKLHLRTIRPEVKSEIRYSKNMTSIIKDEDISQITTRIYPKGFGEGANQLTIEDINAGVPYIDSPNKLTYGIRSVTLVDKRYRSAETLIAYARTVLSQTDKPYTTYNITALDLFAIDSTLHKEFRVGDMVQIIDLLDGIQVKLPILRVSKRDILGDKGNIEIILGNEVEDITKSITNLQVTARISELYSQGTTNQLQITSKDNADSTHSLKSYMYLPSSVRNINECMLSWECSAFRSTIDSLNDNGAQDLYSYLPIDIVGSTGETKGATSTISSGNTSTIRDAKTYQSTQVTTSYEQSPINTVNTGYDGGGGNHLHDYTYINDAGNVERGTTGINGNMASHNHTYQVPTGTHSHMTARHTHSIPNHLHVTSSHKHTVDNHNHSINIYSDATHTHRIYNHNHTINYGIKDGNYTSDVKVIVDGVQIPESDLTNPISIIDYLSVDGGGIINRDYKHVIEILPSGSTRIESDIFLQTFIDVVTVDI